MGTPGEPNTGRGAQQERGWLQLRHDGREQVVVTPEDLDRFVLSSRDAVHACMNQEMAKRFEAGIREAFQSMAELVGEWCRARPQVVAAAIMRSDDRLVCEIATAGSERNLELDDEVSELDLELFNRFREFHPTVRTLPAADRDPWDPARCARDVLIIYAQPADS